MNIHASNNVAITNKIFGIGLSRTGTKSVHEALRILGYQSIHYPRAYKFIGGKLEISKSILEKFEALNDTPVALSFAELDLCFPGSKFIYTIREIQSWLKSCEVFFFEGHFKDKKTMELMNKLYGNTYYNRDTFINAYYSHHNRVMDYFKNRMDDLLVINVCAGEGWDKLCSFLGNVVPENPFPKK